LIARCAGSALYAVKSAMIGHVLVTGAFSSTDVQRRQSVDHDCWLCAVSRRCLWVAKRRTPVIATVRTTCCLYGCASDIYEHLFTTATRACCRFHPTSLPSWSVYVQFYLPSMKKPIVGLLLNDVGPLNIYGAEMKKTPLQKLKYL